METKGFINEIIMHVLISYFRLYLCYGFMAIIIFKIF